MESGTENTNPFFALYEGDNYYKAFKKCKKALLDYESVEQYKYSNVIYKNDINEIPLKEWCKDGKPSKAKAISYSKKLLFNSDKRVADKWKQIGVIEYSNGKYLFFGWLVVGEHKRDDILKSNR